MRRPSNWRTSATTLYFAVTKIFGTVLPPGPNCSRALAQLALTIDDCFFQIGGRNYDFVASTLQLGTGIGPKPLHITDDWALVSLKEPVGSTASPQPVPRLADLATGASTVKVTMVSPAGHGNFAGQSSIESCEIREIDPPSEGGVRRARHDCNDGFGASGSGLFDEAGHLIAMQSASLDMNRRLAFDIGLHYGSALLIEGHLRDEVLRRLDREIPPE